MRADYFVERFESALAKLRAEIEQFPSDEALWVHVGDINNPAGNLCLHLMGNLNHYVGSGIGKSGYIRNRPLEFDDRGASRADLLSGLEKTRKVVLNTLKNISEDGLNEVYRAGDPGSKERTVGEELGVILEHFNYHLGQINYHRRLTASK